MHGSRQQVRAGGSPEWEQNTYLLGTRAMQAGGITAAGAGLIELAKAFGGPADYPEQQQPTCSDSKSRSPYNARSLRADHPWF